MYTENGYNYDYQSENDQESFSDCSGALFPTGYRGYLEPRAKKLNSWNDFPRYSRAEARFSRMVSPERCLMLRGLYLEEASKGNSAKTHKTWREKVRLDVVEQSQREQFWASRISDVRKESGSKTRLCKIEWACI
jgi:hypothetical protein